MSDKILKPKYVLGGEGITVSYMKDTNVPGSVVAGFNWKNTPFPYYHKHTHWEIMLVLNGKVKHFINNITQTATRGYACLIRPNDEHCLIFKIPKSETLTFCFSDQVAEKLFALFPLSDAEVKTKDPLAFQLQESTLDAVISKTLSAQFYPKDKYEKYTVLIINRLILAYNEQKLNTTEAYPEWLNFFLLHLKNPQHLGTPIAELAKSTPYSYSHLSMLFKQYTGKTIVSYITELKLIRAKELLRNTDYTIGDIAIELNYESISSLNHNFKKFTGLTPSQFRKSSSDF